MIKKKRILLDFKIDRLTDSIENTVTGDRFQTDIIRSAKSDLKEVTKKNGWNFNWNSEFNQKDRDVYKLSIVNNPTVIHGLISFTVNSDHVFINLLESAPFNIGRNKIYEGVPGNLIAFACKVSFQYGNDGFVSFYSKTKLIDHYVKTLGAYHFGKQLIVIPPFSAKQLIEKYFKK